MASNPPAGPETPIAVKISYNGANKKFKLHLGDLTPTALVPKLRSVLDIPADKTVTFERFSDSNMSYMSLEPTNLSNYKSLQRAAKAKLKLRLRVAEVPPQPVERTMEMHDPIMPTRLTLRQKQSAKTLGNPLFSASEATLTNSSGGGVRVDEDGITRNFDHLPLPDAPLTIRLQARRNLFFANLARQNAQVEADRRASLEKNMRAAALEEYSRVTAKSASVTPAPASQCTWAVYCNKCEEPIPNEHFHCNKCDDGDYDLCSKCVEDGKHCKISSHWLIKRTIVNGQVMNSSTHRVSQKTKTEVETRDNAVVAPPQEEIKPKEMPGAFTEEKKPEFSSVETASVSTRTCNSCIKVLPEEYFMHCQTCEDFDLCETCLTDNKHGHHPGHSFQPAVAGAVIGPYAQFVAPAGRNVRHAAICDNCNVNIYGVRHKCMECPDWDYCSKCIEKAPTVHPGHRFTSIYEPLPETFPHTPSHFGIYCDGPLCVGTKSYVQGIRFKCAICNDLDFCGNCEASPLNKHNRTHPLIKFKTPVKNVSVTTLGEDVNGLVKTTLGDGAHLKTACRSASAASSNGLSKVHPILDVKPVGELPIKAPPKEKIEIKDLLSEPIQEKFNINSVITPPLADLAKVELNAHFVRDMVADGTKIQAGSFFPQSWTLKNPGPFSWPPGCAVCFVGGDSMRANEGNTGAMTSTIIARPVHVGEEVSFGVLLQAGQREGTSISYWRLKTPAGLAFGHRLWCHIETVAPAKPAVSAVEVGQCGIPTPRGSDIDEFLEVIAERRRTMNRLTEQKEPEATRDATLPDQNAPPQPRIGASGRALPQFLNREAEQAHMRQMRLLSEARLAALQRLKQESAARMNNATKYQPTVEDAEEKEQMQAGPTYPARDIRSYMPAVSAGQAQQSAPFSELSSEQRDRLNRQIEARRFGKQAQITDVFPTANAAGSSESETRVQEARDARVSKLKAMLVEINKKREVEEAATAAVANAQPVPAPVPNTVAAAAPATKAVELAAAVPKAEAPEQKSTMIFPKLDKESPASSMHEIASDAAAAPTSPAMTTATATETIASPRTENLELFDDGESVELVDASSDDSSDGGFLTDDEYDVLGASDEEFA